MQKISPMWFKSAGLMLFGLILLSVSNIFDFLKIDVTIFRIASGCASICVFILGFVFGSNNPNWIWRTLWKFFPSLNKKVFPDINGVWIGTTQSNWTAIEKVRSAASSGQKLDLDDLFDLGLLKGGIAIVIDAGLFSLRIRSRQAGTSSNSYSLSASVEKFRDEQGFSLSYTYRQENPEYVATDESDHIGAAILNFDYADLNSATGSYWTRRCWLDGRNTAGKLELRRVSNVIDTSRASLLSYAQAAQNDG
ncbi:MAG: hypothetical protein R3E09_12920 [Novosphingobium sp.]